MRISDLKGLAGFQRVLPATSDALLDSNMI